MAKAELARKAGVSESTIDRIEAGHDCRMETKRKILFALGFSIQESGKLFPAAQRRQWAAAPGEGLMDLFFGHPGGNASVAARVLTPGEEG